LKKKRLAMGVIYKIQSIAKPNWHYIGSAANFNRRKKQHINDLKKNNHHNILLQRHFNKYGINDFIFSTILDVDDNEKLISQEQLFLDTTKPKFNICKKAGSLLGNKHSEEFKERQRDRMRGNKHGLGKRPKLGIPFPEASKKKSSETQKGRKRGPFTEDHKQKIGLANKTRIWSDASREKQRNHRLGKRLSEETKNKMRAAKKQERK
jgi:group I intron endonuclease